MAVSRFSPRLGDRTGLAEKRRRLLRFHWIEIVPDSRPDGLADRRLSGTALGNAQRYGSTGLGGHLGQHPFPPYFGHLRRDYHHPVQHMVMGNIMGEGSAAAQTNDALDYTVDWANDRLRHGLEHLSGDEVVHVNSGKVWGRRLRATDPERYWARGKEHAYAAASAIFEAQRAFGLSPDLEKQTARIEREFAAFAHHKERP